ncbi:MAG: hypothetical protein KC503_37645 [Myxococcales bacterium]|nr:hypothetical protein [Myxococcales bacterium]
MKTWVTQAEDSWHKSHTFKYLAILATAGAVLVAIYCAQFLGKSLGRFAGALAVGLLAAGACFVTGFLLGLLFGIPRAAGSDNGTSTHSANNNLVQVSDWLTKILLGVGLTQISAIGDFFQNAASYLSDAFSGSAADKAFSVALLVYFLIVGFINGYVATRLVLSVAIRDADRSLQEALGATAAQLDRIESSSDSETAANEVKAARTQLESVLGELVRDPKEAKAMLSDLGRKFEKLRETMASGDGRTHEMTKIVTQARGLSRTLRPTFREIETLFRAGSEGDRVIALAVLQNVAEPQGVNIVCEAIAHSRSAFEQYHALRAAEVLLPNLDEAQRAKLVASIEEQRADGPRRWLIPENRERYALSSRILKETGSST